MYGDFYMSTQAGSFRAELLAFLVIHARVSAFEHFYAIKTADEKICCNNQGALFKSKDICRHIPTGALQADIKCALCNKKAEMKTEFKYEWMESRTRIDTNCYTTYH
jgi:hypothetical protein